MTTYEFAHSIRTTADADTIWQLWADAARWPAWDTSVTAVELDGPFAEGTTGTMHLADQPPVTINLTKVTPGIGFDDETEIPGAVLRFIHFLQPHTDGGVTVTHRVEITGDDENMIMQLGPAVTEDVPAAMAGLVALAEAAANKAELPA
jgi:hypothetical protein